MVNSARRQELIATAKLIFYGIPVGKNAPGDTPIIGNQSLAQVAINRINSVAKNAEEFKYMTEVVLQFIKDSKDETVSKIKLDRTSKSLVRAGFTDDKGFVIKKN